MDQEVETAVSMVVQPQDKLAFVATPAGAVDPKEPPEAGLASVTVPTGDTAGEGTETPPRQTPPHNLSVLWIGTPPTPATGLTPASPEEVDPIPYPTEVGPGVPTPPGP